jgi:hypothetical protein
VDGPLGVTMQRSEAAPGTIGVLPGLHGSLTRTPAVPVLGAEREAGTELFHAAERALGDVRAARPIAQVDELLFIRPVVDHGVVPAAVDA